MSQVVYSIEDLPAILTVKEVADLLRMDVKSVYLGIQRGEIPARKVGRR